MASDWRGPVSSNVFEWIGLEHTLRVHKEGLLACCRVSSNNGVLCCDGVTTGNSALVQAVIDLLDAGVQSLEAMEAFLELRGETPVG